MTGLGTIINSDQQRKVYAGGTLSCDRVCLDLLCRDKSGLGKEIKCSEYAAICITCDFSGICSLKLLN